MGSTKCPIICKSPGSFKLNRTAFWWIFRVFEILKKPWWYRETCPTLKSGWTGLQCPGGRIDSSKGISLFETLADSFHGLTKNSFDKKQVSSWSKTPTPSRYKISSKKVNTVNHSKPRLRNELFYNPSIWAFWLGLLNAHSRIRPRSRGQIFRPWDHFRSIL